MELVKKVIKMPDAVAVRAVSKKNSAYVCTLCPDNRFYFQRIDWRDHMHHRHVEVYYKCDSCAYRVKSRANMRTHVLKHHKRGKTENEQIAHYPNGKELIDSKELSAEFCFLRLLQTNMSDRNEVFSNFVDVAIRESFLAEANRSQPSSPKVHPEKS